jgi:hypothetical protein
VDHPDAAAHRVDARFLLGISLPIVVSAYIMLRLVLRPRHYFSNYLVILDYSIDYKPLQL